ncbi:MAG: hypothetical protein AVDCRST_MAG32-3124 [uncultured Nocardioides sp.]|uniref:Uncharacterized protein n=1 Tax=uncultured Nocardioides sp. TaxID=198441 RepID=A0A6J4P908_9ACTN|nr:MAG: hypothetical protein AVDCRST_MAG32-3124 [uncultured Nocardioides sp.]
MSPDSDQPTDQDGQEGQISETEVGGGNTQPVSTEDPAADQPKDGTGGVHAGDGDSHQR